MNRTEQRKESWEVCCLLPHSDKDLIPMVQKGGKRLEEERRKKRERERKREDGLDAGIIGYVYMVLYRIDDSSRCGCFPPE